MNDKQGQLITAFGLTSSANKAGFILPDGSLLDFSNVNRSHRIYHAEALNVIYGVPCKGKEWTDLDLVLLLSELSLIRFCSEGLIHTANKPTPQQFRQLYKMVAYRSNPFEVLISHCTGISMSRTHVVSPTMSGLLALFKIYDQSPIPFCSDEFQIEEDNLQLNLIFRPLQKIIGSYNLANEQFLLEKNYSCVLPLFTTLVADFFLIHQHEKNLVE